MSYLDVVAERFCEYKQSSGEGGCALLAKELPTSLSKRTPHAKHTKFLSSYLWGNSENTVTELQKLKSRDSMPKGLLVRDIFVSGKILNSISYRLREGSGIIEQTV